MIVVSDASPLIGLAHIGRLTLLRDLYDRVLIPDAVHREVVLKRPEGAGAAEVAMADWISVEPITNRQLARALLAELGPGESEAITLAAEAPGSLLLVDERLARRTAARLGVHVVGVLGVLVEAKQKGLIPAVRPLLDDLVALAGFRISPELHRRVIEAAGESAGHA